MLFEDRAQAGDEPEAVADARRFRMDEASIEAVRRATAQALGRAAGALDFAGVWPAHVEAVGLLVAAGTQWRTATVSDGEKVKVLWIGLDYQAVKVAADAAGLTLDSRRFWQLRELEDAARAALNGSAQ